MSHRYLGTDPPSDEPGEVRMIIRVVPEKVAAFSA
jgi:hypothetical protein